MAGGLPCGRQRLCVRRRLSHVGEDANWGGGGGVWEGPGGKLPVPARSLSRRQSARASIASLPRRKTMRPKVSNDIGRGQSIDFFYAPPSPTRWSSSAPRGPAYKKIFPSLQAMVKRGHLDVPVIGVAKASWSLDQLKARARESVEKHGGLDTVAFEKLTLCCATSTATTRTRRRSRPSARSWAPHSGRPTTSPYRRRFRNGRGTAGQGGLHRQAPASSSRSLRHRPGLGKELNRIQPGRSTRGRSSASITTWQAARPQHALLPLRERVPGAVLEPRARRARADHDGRETSGCRDEEGSTTRRGPSATWSRTICSRC